MICFYIFFSECVFQFISIEWFQLKFYFTFLILNFFLNEEFFFSLRKLISKVKLLKTLIMFYALTTITAFALKPVTYMYYPTSRRERKYVWRFHDHYVLTFGFRIILKQVYTNELKRGSKSCTFEKLLK